MMCKIKRAGNYYKLISILIICLNLIGYSNILASAEELNKADLPHELNCSDWQEISNIDTDKYTADIEIERSNFPVSPYSKMKTFADGITNFYEVEPNSSIGLADYIDSNYYGQTVYSIYGTITDYYFDLDYYRFDISESGTFYSIGIWAGNYFDYGWEEDLAFILVDANDNNIAYSSLYTDADGKYQGLVANLSPGTYYLVVLQLFESDFYVGEHYNVVVDFAAHTVPTPTVPTGISAGTINNSYTFSTSTKQCSFGHDLQYRFAWGDGTYSGWSNSSTATKSWSSPGTYTVRSQVRCFADASIVSSWSQAKTVSIAKQHQILVSPTPTAGGSVTGGGTYNDGSQVSLLASPAPGYYFVSWLENGKIVSEEQSYSFIANNNRTLTARFALSGSSARLTGSTRYDTSVSISKDSFPAVKSADAVVLARGDDFADALPGGVLAHQKNGPLLLTATNSVPPIISAEIQRVLKDNGTIYILGGSVAISANVEAQLSALGNFNIVRISGSSRMDTAYKIAEEIGNVSGKAIVAYSHDFPDALAISSYAAKEGIPILLTYTNTLHEQTNAYLNNYQPYVYVVGGGNAVPHHVYDQIAGIVGINNLKRLGGSTRYDTARLIAEEFFPDPSTASLVFGFNFPDALTGGVHAARLNAPILLVSTTSIPAATQQYLILKSAFLNKLYVYGGTKVVSDTVRADASELIY